MWRVNRKVLWSENKHLYGFVIEFHDPQFDDKGPSSWNYWQLYWNYKIYPTEKIAKESMEHVRRTKIFDTWEFRLRPLFYE